MININKSTILNLISSNAYFNSFFYSHWKPADTKKYLSIVNDFKSDDSIQDTSNLSLLKKEIDSGKKWIPGDINLANSLNYGIKKSVFPFELAQLHKPSIEHGMIFYDAIFEDTNNTAPITTSTMGPFRQEIIQKHRQIPVFVVGPYIQYAEPFYKENQFATEKKKLGKTLLVFPSHSTNLSSVSLDEKIYIAKINEIATEYDSVVVCSFWWNLNDPLIEMMKSSGFRVVSAGFRDDPNFLPRLKTIIRLADLAVGDSIGTNVGYCFSEKIPFKLLDTNTAQKTMVNEELKGEPDRQKKLNDLRYALCSDNTQAINSYLSYYWGMDIFYSEKDRRIMCDIEKDILKTTFGFTQNINQAIHKLKNQYKSQDQRRHLELLIESCQFLD